MFYWLWIKRFVFSSRNIFQLSSFFSVLSLSLGVAILTVALLAVNGFYLSLENIIIDKSGHVVVFSKEEESQKDILNSLYSSSSQLESQMPFLSFKGLILNDSRFKGVLFEGVDFENSYYLSRFKRRVLKGDLKNMDASSLIVGSQLAKELNLKVNSHVRVLTMESKNSIHVSRRKQSFSVAAILDFGKYDFNSRWVLMPLTEAQLLTERKNQISGVRLWLKHHVFTDTFVKALKMQDEKRQILSWKELEKSFFNIIDSDKKIIFLVLLILIIAAGFNVSSSLFIQVLSKTKDISVLKAMGAKNHFIITLFLLKGLVLGAFGGGFGILGGMGLFHLGLFLQRKWNFIPESVYQLNSLVFQWKSWDLVFIFLSVLVVSLVAAFFPAVRACRLPIKKGLDYN